MKAVQLSKKYKTLLEKHSVNTPLRLAMFFAQIAHESAGFRYTKELGGTSYFKKYEGRKDLGNTQPGDGLRYKGRGFIQVTGKYNYAEISKDTGIDYLNNPEWLEREPDAMLSALWYWDLRKLNYYADRKDLKGATRVINGGYNGLADRQAKYDKYLKVFSNEK